ncbi:MAG: M48 family metallopeptidase [Synechococcales bacterium]|nr:M48 family metallopeptidase [Synechococcales bacterium]
MSIELPPGTAAPRDDRNPSANGRQLLILLGLFVGTIIFVVWLAGFLVSSLITLIPPGVEQQLGAVIVPIYEQQAQPSDVQTTLNDMLDRLEEHLPEDHQEREYQVLYIPDPTVNAIAIPGDRVIIYEGLLAEMESENELMMVLGHELGHFLNRDHLRGLGRQVAVRLALASIFGDAGSLGSLASSGVIALTNSEFSKGQERQADEVGLTLLNQTYGHAAGATDFFARMSEQRGSELDFLATHPTSKSRVERIEKLIRQRDYTVGERSPLPDALRAIAPASQES